VTTILGDPALRLLARRKLRGVVRRQLRRMRTVKGALLTLLGVGLFGVWLTAIGVGFVLSPGERPDPEPLRPLVRMAGTVFVLIGAVGALSNRGLYIPTEEIERLFSGPVSRADVVRYRLTVTLGRSAFGGLIMGLITMRHMPVPAFAFCGVFLGLLTLPVLSQSVAILSGALEKRIVERTSSLRTLIGFLLGAVALLLVLFAATGADRGFGEALREFLPTEGLSGLARHPVVASLSLPFEPWARAITATTLAEFLPWAGACALIWIAVFEAAARLRIDYRELSLETSASVAARIRRVRGGAGGAAAARISRRTLGWRVPWLFGRGPLGAIAWRKTGSILRRARGTLVVSTLVLVFITVLSLVTTAGDEPDPSAVGPGIVALLGVFYLGAGLRFDFREDLDRMESLKAWPVKPARLFLGMLLPEVVLVSCLLVTAVLVRALLGSAGAAVDPLVWWIVAFLPPFILAWVSLDNAAFLVAPVRFVPGSDGALQNAGRSIIMLLVRGVALSVTAGLVLGAGFGVRALAGWLPSPGGPSPDTLGIAAGWVMLLVVDAALVLVGGAAFRRFDVASDRA
jgi:hypothetical protein